jgi:hypothetical protein
MEWVSERDCCVGFFNCEGSVQAHHLLKPWTGSRGLGMRADDRNVVPLCAKHHYELHFTYGNEARFFEHYLEDSEAGKKIAEDLWNDSPHFNEKTGTKK